MSSRRDCLPTYLRQVASHLCWTTLLTLLHGWQAHLGISYSTGRLQTALKGTAGPEGFYCKYAATKLDIMWEVWEVPLAPVIVSLTNSLSLC